MKHKKMSKIIAKTIADNAIYNLSFTYDDDTTVKDEREFIYTVLNELCAYVDYYTNIVESIESYDKNDLIEIFDVKIK